MTKKIRFRLIAFILIFISILLINFTPFTDTHYYNISDVSEFRDTDFLPILFTLWQINASGRLFYTPALVDITNDGILDIIFSCTDTDTVHAVNGKNGSFIWNYTATPVTALSTSDLDNDGKPEVVLGQPASITVLNAEDGSLLWNYPISIWCQFGTPPMIGDVNNDGLLEVIAGSQSIFTTDPNKLYAFHGKNGTVMWNDTATDVYSENTMGDLDKDGVNEVIAGDGNVIYARNGENGFIHWTYTGASSTVRTMVLADIDNNGYLEVLVGTDTEIFALDGLFGIMIWTRNIGVENSLALGDLDNDEKLEVIFGVASYIYALNAEDGSTAWKFYSNTGAFHGSSPSICDHNNDGQLDVVVGNSDGKVYVLSGNNGSLIWGYSTLDYIYASPILVDLDGDDELETIVCSSDYFLYVFNLFINGKRLYWEANGGTISCDRTNNLAYIDTDMDFLSDYSEPKYGCDFNDTDSDDDGIIDGKEVTLTLNPINNDSDSDGLSDGHEFYNLHTDPAFNDTDGDLMLDGWEVKYGLDPLVPNGNEDPDFDGLTNFEEFSSGTLPLDPDSDGDGLSDGQEVNIYNTDPLDWDTDDDGLSDGFEVNRGLNPDTSNPAKSSSFPNLVFIVLTLIVTVIFIYQRKT